MTEQLIVNISAVVVAVCALVVSIWQVRQGIKHKKLSVKPTLTSWTEMNPDVGYYCIWVINNGLGPAIIESFTVKVDDHVMPGVAHEPIEKAVAEVFPKAPYNLHSSFMAKGYAMPAKEKHKICEITFAGPPPTLESVRASFRRAELLIDYKSIYGDEIFHYSLREHDF